MLIRSNGVVEDQLSDLSPTLALDAQRGGLEGLSYVEWQFSLQTAESSGHQTGEAFEREQGSERLEEHLDLAVSIKG